MTGAASVVALTVGLAAFLGAIAYLVRVVRRLTRIGRAILRIVTLELEFNGGASMRDDVRGIALAVGKLARDFDDHLEGRQQP